MSPLESRAWLQLFGMGPAYIVYFALQVIAPPWLSTNLQHLACFAAASLFHAAVFLTGLVLLRGRERGQGLMSDERDAAIDGRATRSAYLLLMAGVIAFGVMAPFKEGGWRIVNGALLSIVAAEVLRNVLIVVGYRGTPRLAH